MRHDRLLIIISIFCMTSCEEEVLPKPRGMLRLDYPEVRTQVLTTSQFQFEYNGDAVVRLKDDGSLTLEYPDLKGAIFITFKKVDDNLDKLLTDAQKLSMEHVVKADAINPSEFVNEVEQVYGMYYEIRGNAASQAQFYVTDSIHNFVTGSLYFYVRPNYDSIYPAALYLQNDIRTIMESFQWK